MNKAYNSVWISNTDFGLDPNTVYPKILSDLSVWVYFHKMQKKKKMA